MTLQARIILLCVLCFSLGDWINAVRQQAMGVETFPLLSTQHDNLALSTEVVHCRHEEASGMRGETSDKILKKVQLLKIQNLELQTWGFRVSYYHRDSLSCIKKIINGLFFLCTLEVLKVWFMQIHFLEPDQYSGWLILLADSDIPQIFQYEHIYCHMWQ